MVVVGPPVDLLYSGEGIVFHVPYGILPISDVSFHWGSGTWSLQTFSDQLPVLYVEESYSSQVWSLYWKLVVTGVVDPPVLVYCVAVYLLALFQT